MSIIILESNSILILLSFGFLTFYRGEELKRIAPDDKKAKIYMLGDFMKGRLKIIEDPFDVSFF